MPHIFKQPADLLGADGTQLERTEPLAIEQQRINLFADATEDHQWIHVDTERASRESDAGSTIAHGYLTLSLVNFFLPRMLVVENFSSGINYGLDKVRFLSPVKTGSLVYGEGEILQVDEYKGGIRSFVRVAVGIVGEERPACLAETISLYYP